MFLSPRSLVPGTRHNEPRAKHLSVLVLFYCSPHSVALKLNHNFAKNSKMKLFTTVSQAIQAEREKGKDREKEMGESAVLSIFTSRCVLQHTQSFGRLPTIPAGVNYLFSLKICSNLPRPRPSFPFDQASNRRHPTTLTSSQQQENFLLEKSAAEVDFCSVREAAGKSIRQAAFCLLQIILTVVLRILIMLVYIHI